MKNNKRPEIARNELHFHVQLKNKRPYYSKKYNRAREKRSFGV